MPRTAPADVRSLARSHTRSAILSLARLMRGPNVPPPVRLAAANALLDRGWGKPPQPLAGDQANPLRLQITEIVRTIVDPNPFALIDAAADGAEPEPALPPPTDEEE